MKHHPRSIATRRPRTCRRAFSGLLGLVSLFVVLSTAEADAATLDLTGPAGAEVVLDGDVRGVLPLPRPLVVEVGDRVLRVRRGGYVTHEEVVQVTSDDQAIVMEIEMIQLSRWQAMGSSAALAGLGQLYQSRPKMGWTMMALQIGAWSWLFFAEEQYQSTRDDYLTALTEYEIATTITEIDAARAAATEAYDDLESKNDVRTYATVTVIAIGAWSVYDAWRAHAGFHDGATTESPVRTAVSHDAGGTHVKVGWRWTF